MSERALYSEDAERGALGAILLEPTRVIECVMRMDLKAEAFFVPGHRTIFEAMMAISGGERDQLDILTLGEELRRAGKLDSIGGAVALDNLIDGTPTAAHAEYYLDIVRQKWVLRQIAALSRQIETEAQTAASGDALLKDIPQRYIEITGEERTVETNEQIMDRSIAAWEAAAAGDKKAIGLPYPYEQLTEMLCGLEVGITMLAARPSQGKTTIEDELCVSLAMQGVPVGRITLDSTADELLQRAMSRIAGVSLPKLKYGWVRQGQLDQVRDARDLLKTLPMHFCDNERELRRICAKARAWKLKHDIQILTVDFIQLVEASDMGRSQWDRNLCVGYVSKTLKALALQLRIPILVLSQLSRALEKDSREPQLSDLRDSGSLEQDAHKVFFVYKDAKVAAQMEMKKPGATKYRRPMWMKVDKHKDGEVGRVPFWMYPHYFRFEEIKLTRENSMAPFEGGIGAADEWPT
jgi:replicative DNA helicase